MPPVRGVVRSGYRGVVGMLLPVVVHCWRACAGVEFILPLNGWRAGADTGGLVQSPVYAEVWKLSSSC